MGALRKAMHRARHGLMASELHISVVALWSGARDFGQVDDLMCIASSEELLWLFSSLEKKLALKKHILEPGSECEVKYLNLVPRRGAQGMSGGVA